MEENIHTDKPAEKQSQDRFQRYEFSKRIASIISSPNNEKSLIVGLYGKWGEGKSTVLNFIENELPAETIVVKFNPWLFTDERYLLNAFFESFAFALNKSEKSAKEKIGNFLSDYAGAIGSITQFIGASTDGIEKLGVTLKTVPIEKTKERIDQFIVDSGKNIVVLIDDIDRLDVNEVQYIFKVVKLVGDFPRTSYVLAFDDEMVSKALAPKYSGTTSNTGYQFLEKIVQIPIKLPKASPKALRKYTLELVEAVIKTSKVELNKSDLENYLESFDNSFLPWIDNPRLGVRYANSLTFSIPLLKNEVNISDLMLVEGMKIFFPEIYDFIRLNPDPFFASSGYNANYLNEQKKGEDAKKEIDQAINIYALKKQKAILKILEKLFPQIESLYRNTIYSDESYKKWIREKKICSSRYFGRYFSYAVQDNDIPDQFFDQFLIDLKTLEITSTIKKLKQFLKDVSPSDFIFKLRIWEESLDSQQSQNLSLIIAEIGDTFPKEQDFHFATTFAQSASLIARLILNIPKENQFDTTIKLLEAAKTIEYSMEIHYWIMYRDAKDSTNNIFSATEEVLINEKLIEKFRILLNEHKDNFFSLLSDNELQRLLDLWSCSNKYRLELEHFLKNEILINKESALRFLKIYVPTIDSYGTNGHKVFKSGFNKTRFESLKKIADVSLLYNTLKENYGLIKLEKEPSAYSDREEMSDELIMALFQYFFQEDIAFN